MCACSDSRPAAVRQRRATSLCAPRDGRFVTGIDDDDEMLPNRISSLLQAFDEQYSFVCSGTLLQFGHLDSPVPRLRLRHHAR